MPTAICRIPSCSFQTANSSRGLWRSLGLRMSDFTGKPLALSLSILDEKNKRGHYFLGNELGCYLMLYEFFK